MKLIFLAAIIAMAALAMVIFRKKQPSTTAVKREFKHEDDGRKHITTVFENGLKVRQDIYGDYGAVYVTYFDRSGYPTRMQLWAETIERNPNGEGMVYTYFLSLVTEYYPATNVVQRTFSLNEAGDRLWDSTQFDGNGKISSQQRYFGDDGTLCEEVFADEAGNLTRSVPHKPEEGIRGQFTPESIAWPDGLGEDNQKPRQ